MSVDPHGQIQTQIFVPQMSSQVSEQPKKQSLGLQVNLSALRMFEYLHHLHQAASFSLLQHHQHDSHE